MEVESDLFTGASHLEQKGVVGDKDQIVIGIGDFKSYSVQHFLYDTKRLERYSHCSLLIFS